MRRVKATIRTIWSEAKNATTKEEAQALASWAVRSQHVTRLQAVLTVASTEPEVALRASDFDRDPFLLNCLNGTLDLRTGELRDHRREDLITKLVTIKYQPGAESPTWERFIFQILNGNVELAAYVQRVVGYALTGSVVEQVWFFLYGTGANGKSTFLLILLDVTGEYGKQAAPELLLAKRGEVHPTEVADLAGCRVAVCTEIEQGRGLAEVQVKQLTGGDRVKGRFMRQNFFEFCPTHKLLLGANHKPAVRGTDYASWRRIHLIPFTVTFSEKEQDRRLFEKLRAELSGILAWAVQGCLAWQREGLRPPPEVLAATETYREEEDILGEFLGEQCILRSDLTTAARDLYAAYSAWCTKNTERPISQKAFGGQLAERGLTRRKAGSGRRWWWIGIGLTDPTDPLSPEMGTTAQTHTHEDSSPDSGPMGPSGSPPLPGMSVDERDYD